MSQPDSTALAANELEMTAAETAALEPEDAGTPPEAGAPAVAAEGPVPAAAAGAEGEGAADPVAAAAAAAVPVEGTAVDPPAPAVVQQPPPMFVPTYTPEAREFATEIGQINTQLSELKVKYKAGDVEDERYEELYEQLRDQRGEIERARDLATLQQQMSQQNADQSWAYLQRQFLSDAQNAAIAGNELLFAAWEQGMQSVVNEASSAGRPLTDWDILVGARQKLVEAGMLQASAQQAPPQAPVPAKPDRTPPLAQVPPTLSAVPAAADPSSRATADAAAEQSIEELEAFLAGRSESERDRILKDVPGAFVADN